MKDHVSNDASYTAAAEYMTAAKVGKSYDHEFPPSANSNKSASRTDDGPLSSGAYVAMGGVARDGETPQELELDFHHPLEKWIAKKPVRWVLALLSRPDKNGSTPLQRMLETYRNPDASLWQKIKYSPIHFAISRLASDEGWDKFADRSKQFNATVRGINIVARSLAKFGPVVPQQFVAPLMVVWNFTNRCNLKCKHCYQDSEHAEIPDELTLEEKLAVVDQMKRHSVPMVAISGGEPTLSPDLIPVIERASAAGMHISIATNGTTLTPARCEELRDAGLRYVEISLDSVDAARHDAFRGIEGMWEKSVAGARNVVATEGLRLGIAMCVHQGNFDEVRQMIDFAENDLGAGCLAHFNFIPVGRGLNMVSGDITPAQREELLSILNEKMQAGGMGIISTAPQLGRICLAGAALDDGLVTCSHAGGGSGAKARVVAKYLGGCGAGRCYVAIEPNGNVTPCVYLPHRVMGNLRDGDLGELFRNSVFWEILNDRTRRLGHCEVCTFADYCGGCRARADAYFGQLHAADPGCVFNQTHWQKLVDDGVAIVPDDLEPASMEISPQRHSPG
jgi:radical SAM protein with 4Fe4S-binding SPASM domain